MLFLRWKKNAQTDTVYETYLYHRSSELLTGFSSRGRSKHVHSEDGSCAYRQSAQQDPEKKQLPFLL